MDATQITLTTRRTASTAGADDVRAIARQPARGIVYYAKARPGEGQPAVHLGYVEHLADCVRLFDRAWHHRATVTTTAEAIGHLARFLQEFAGEPEAAPAEPSPFAFLDNHKEPYHG